MTSQQTQLIEAIEKELNRRYDRIITLIDERYKLSVENLSLQSQITRLEKQLESLQVLLHEHKHPLSK